MKSTFLIKRKDEGDKSCDHLCEIYTFAGGKVLQLSFFGCDDNLHCNEAARMLHGH